MMAKLLILLLLTSLAAAQKPAGKRNQRPEEPGVSQPKAVLQNEKSESDIHFIYQFEQPEFVVRRIVIEHGDSGVGTITFERKNDTAPLKESIKISPSSLDRINQLWMALSHLSTGEDLQSVKQFPHLGTHKLVVQKDSKKQEAVFNWTDNRSGSDLVAEYRRIADQSLFVFDINIARENLPLETPKILERLGILLSRKGLSDPKQLIPLLKELAVDERLPLIARNHANRLLKKIEN
jgi:hypothetical protein